MRALEVCSGIGGLALGLEWAGWEIAGLCEADECCRQELELHWPHVPILTDLEKVTDAQLDAVGHVDLLAGGIPCQPWSHAGKRGGSRDERDLWPSFLDLLDRTGARCVLVENVPGLATDIDGLDRIAPDLEARGYAWWACRLRAADVGAPHLRDRLWVCAMADRPSIRRREGRPEPAGQQRRHDAAERGASGSLADSDRPGSLLAEQPPGRHPVQVGQQLRADVERRHPDTRTLADLRGEGRKGGWRAGAGLQRPTAKRAGAAGSAGAVGNASGGPAQRRGEPGELRGSTAFAGDEGRQWERSRDAANTAGAGLGPLGQPKAQRLPPWSREQAHGRPAAQPQRSVCWDDARPILCRDGKWRLVPAEPAFFPLAHGTPGRVARLKALGNAVVPAQAYVPARALYEVASAALIEREAA